MKNNKKVNSISFDNSNLNKNYYNVNLCIEKIINNKKLSKNSFYELEKYIKLIVKDLISRIKTDSKQKQIYPNDIEIAYKKQLLGILNSRSNNISKIKKVFLTILSMILSWLLSSMKLDQYGVINNINIRTILIIITLVLIITLIIILGE